VRRLCFFGLARNWWEGLDGRVPIAPASNRASACTSPSPLAAPDTRTTLSTRLNSGRRFAVPRCVGGLPF
jgi:hypothetical protein